jgi:1,4-dihydroxy-2-naphthoate octaprenyltransferase
VERTRFIRNQKPARPGKAKRARDYRNQNKFSLVTGFWLLVSILRYRFFLFAGFLPYLLGQALAYNYKGSLHWSNFYLGLGGLFFVLLGIETFNEYFDVALGTELVFSQDKIKTPSWIFKLGLTSFAIAFIFALILTLKLGLAILGFALIGFFASFFYLGPPLRLAYRGLGELVIGLSYGPLLTLGSFWVQEPWLYFPALFVSIIVGLLMFALALINEVPDYYQDYLVGKRNIVVRVGQKKAVLLYSIVFLIIFSLFVWGIFLKLFSVKVGLVFLATPLAWQGLSIARKHYNQPQKFIPAIRNAIFLYIIILTGLILTYIQR